ELEDRDRLVDAAQPALGLAGELHHHGGASLVFGYDLASAQKVRVGVEALFDLLDGEIEHRRLEPFASSGRHGRESVSAGPPSGRSSCRGRAPGPAVRAS